MKREMLVVLATAVVGLVDVRLAHADALPDPVGGVITIDIAADVEYTTPIGAGVTAVVKKGVGTATLRADNSSYAGTMAIEAGTVKGEPAAFGKPTLLEVKSGGCADMTSPGKLNATLVKIAGAGSNGGGALRYSGSAQSTGSNFLNALELTADATIFNGGRLLFTPINLTLNGHELTKIGNDMLSCRGGTLTFQDAGTLCAAEGRWAFEFCGFAKGAALPSYTNVTMRVVKGGDLMLYADYPETSPFPLAVRFEDGAILSPGSWDYAHQNHVGGPVTIDGVLNPRGYGNDYRESVHFDGGISAPNGMVRPNGNLHTFYVNANTNEIKSIVVSNRAAVALSGTSVTKVTSDVTLVGGGWAGADVMGIPATLVLTNSAQLVAGTVNVGCDFYNGNRTYGIVRMYGGSMSNQVQVGTRGGIGAFYQYGGEAVLTGWCDLGVNSQGYGFMSVEGGSLRTIGNEFVVAGNNARGIFWQRGGDVFHKPNRFYMGFSEEGNYTHYRQSGGTSTWKSQVIFGNTSNNLNKNGLFGVLTFDGTAEADMSGSSIVLYATTNAAGQTAMLNFNGGVSKLSHVGRSNQGAQTWDSIRDAARAAGRFYMNFNGGTLKTSEAGNFFWDTLTRVTVWEKGATIDTDGKNVNFSEPLLAPTGKGLASVTMTSATYLGERKLLGPSTIRILGTNGHTADAIMDYDTVTRQVTGVTITSPGVDLGDDITVSHERYYPWHSANDRDAMQFTLRDNPTTGGFTKKGAGTLTLQGVNTYGGATRVEGGLLAFSQANGYPGGDLEFTVDALKTQTTLLRAVSLPFRTGAKIRIVGADQLREEDFRGVKKVVELQNPLAALPEVEWVNAAGEVVKPHGDWTVRLAPDGKSVSFGCLHGFAILVR